jgi:hypothetical protein
MFLKIPQLLFLSLAAIGSIKTGEERENETVIKVETVEGRFEFLIPQSSISRSELVHDCGESILFSVHNNMDHMFRFSKLGLQLFSLHGQVIQTSANGEMAFITPLEGPDQTISEVHAYSYAELCDKVSDGSPTIVRPVFSVGAQSTSLGGKVVFSKNDAFISQQLENSGKFLAIVLPLGRSNAHNNSERSANVLACNTKKCVLTPVMKLNGVAFEAKSFKASDGEYQFDLFDYSENLNKKVKIEFEIKPTLLAEKTN